MFNIEVTVVFWIQESLVRLVDFASLALMLQDPASLFSQHLLLLPAQLILLSFSVRVEEGLDLVLMVMQFQLLLAHVWMSNLELNELIITVSLLLLDITLPLWERHLVLPATIVNIGRFIVLLLMHFSVILRRGFRLGWLLLFAAFALTWALSFALVFALVLALTLALTLRSRLRWLLVLDGRLGATVVLFRCSVIHWIIAKLALFVVIVMMLIFLALLIPFFHLFFEVLRSLLHRFIVIFLPFLLLLALLLVVFRVISLAVLLILRWFFLTLLAFLITVVCSVAVLILVVTLVAMVDVIAVLDSVAKVAVVGRFGIVAAVCTVDGMVDNVVLVVAMVVRLVVACRMVVVNIILSIVVAAMRRDYLLDVMDQRLHLQDKIASLH